MTRRAAIIYSSAASSSSSGCHSVLVGKETLPDPNMKLFGSTLVFVTVILRVIKKYRIIIGKFLIRAMKYS